MKTPITQEIQDIATKFYRIARTELSTGIPATLLHIADEYTIAAFGYDANQPDMIWEFPIGTKITARTHFKHTPPTPEEIEEAIMIIEDEVMPIKKQLDLNSRLFTLDSNIYEIASHAETLTEASGFVLSLGNMEGIFSRLAAIITGRPASTDTLPSEASFAATLLILREFMHHLGYKNITIKIKQA